MTAKQDQLQLIRSTIKIATTLGNRKDAYMLSSFLKQRERKKLSERQEWYLRKLVERNSEQTIRSRQDAQNQWTNEWLSDDQFREKAKVIAEYYLRSGYFRDIAMAVKDWRPDNGVILPPKHKIERMVNNKYAEKVWKSHTTPPLWAVGDMATLRANIRGTYPWLYRPVSQTSLMIIEVDSKPIDKALTYNKSSGGTRYYKVLPVGLTQPIDILECDLKKLLKKQTQ